MPLHLACQEQASLAVLKLLVQAWPEAVKLPNENRFLPLHYACLEVVSDANQGGGWGKRSLEKIEYLIQTAPDTVKMLEQQSGMLPLHCACLDQIASMDGIHFLVESYPKAVTVKDKKGWLPLQPGLHARTWNRNERCSKNDRMSGLCLASIHFSKLFSLL